MFFEWFVFFFLIGLFFLQRGTETRRIEILFLGAVLLIVVGAMMNIQGFTIQKTITLEDNNSSTTTGTINYGNQIDGFTYWIGMLIVLFGLLSMIFGVFELVLQKGKSDG
jgi:hypothetical protein